MLYKYHHICSNLLDMRNLWPFTVRTNGSSDIKNLQIRIEASNFKSFSQSLEHFVLTVGQNNFDYKIPVLIDFPSFLPTKKIFKTPIFRNCSLQFRQKVVCTRDQVSLPPNICCLTFMQTFKEYSTMANLIMCKLQNNNFLARPCPYIQILSS